MVCCFASLVPCSSHAQQTRPREHFQNADVVYDWVTNSRKDKLRTFISHPRNARFKVPVLFFVGWLSCDSVESPQGETDGFSALLLRLITEGKSAAEVNDAMKAFAEFYDLYLIQGETPGQILSQHAQWRNLWYDAPGGQYGRPAAFYHNCRR